MDTNCNLPRVSVRADRRRRVVELDVHARGLTPALVAIRDGALDRFGRVTRAPEVSLESARTRGARGVALRLRAQSRVLTRLRLTLGGRTISRRFLPFFAGGGSSRDVHISFTPSGQQRIREAGGRPRATLHVTLKHMAGNIRRARFKVRL